MALLDAYTKASSMRIQNFTQLVQAIVDSDASILKIMSLIKTYYHFLTIWDINMKPLSYIYKNSYLDSCLFCYIFYRTKVHKIAKIIKTHFKDKILAYSQVSNRLSPRQLILQKIPTHDILILHPRLLNFRTSSSQDISKYVVANKPLQYFS